MKRVLFWLGCLIAWGCCAAALARQGAASPLSVSGQAIPARAEKQPPEPETADVDERSLAQLVEDLGSPRRRTRHDAEMRLIELGEPALPLLIEESPDHPPAVREALHRIIDEIEQNAVARLLQAGLVTIEPRRLALAEAFALLQEQTGNAIDLSGLPASLREREVEVDFDAVPFWQAFDALCEQAQVGWDWSAGRTLAVSPELQPPHGEATVVDGFRLNALSRPRRQDFAAPRVRQVLRMEFRVDVEPRLHPFFLTIEDRDVTLETSEAILSPFNPEAHREIPFPRGQSVTFPIDLRREGEQALGAGTVRGRVHLRCAARRTPITFPLPEPPQPEPPQPEQPQPEQRAGQTEVRFLSMMPAEGGGQVLTLRIRYAGSGPELESHRMGLLHHDAWWNTAEGERVPFSGMQLLRAEGTTHTVRYTFAGVEPGPGTSFTYLVPELISTLEVPFTIEDLPLER